MLCVGCTLPTMAGTGEVRGELTWSWLALTVRVWSLAGPTQLQLQLLSSHALMEDFIIFKINGSILALKADFVTISLQ